MKRVIAIALIVIFSQHGHAQSRPPIIDMHMHANRANDNGPAPMALCIPLLSNFPALDPKNNWEDVFLHAVKNPSCPNPIWSPETDEAMIEETVAVVERLNVIAVLSGPHELVRQWMVAQPDRFIPAVEFQADGSQMPPTEMRRLFESGEFAVMGEVTNQYAGIGPDDERMAPYWAFAEELDIPVGLHMGEGFPGVVFLEPEFRARLSNPLLLEDVLNRHPRLRVYVMHYGTPMVDEMITMLATYPQLYVDIGGIQWFYSRPYFYEQLRQLIDAGFEKRIMFGSDNINWPGIVGPSIDIIEQAPFLSDEQKRDIFYNNAARFLRFSKKEIAAHHELKN